MYHNFCIHSSVGGHLGCFHCPSYCKKCCNKHRGTYTYVAVWRISSTFYLAGVKLMLSNNNSSPPPPPDLSSHHSTSCFYDPDHSRYLMYLEPYSTCLSVAGLFHSQNILKIHLMLKTWQDFFHFEGWIIFYCMYRLHLPYPFNHSWTFRFFAPLLSWIMMLLTREYKYFFEILSSSLLDKYP